MAELTSRACPECGERKTFDVTQDQIDRFLGGEGYVQTIFPELSADDRERLMTGTCPKCWDAMFPDEEDD